MEEDWLINGQKTIREMKKSFKRIEKRKQELGEINCRAINW